MITGSESDTIMACPSLNIIYFLVVWACSILQTSSRSHPHQPQKHGALFIFGDSLFDAGNNNYINTTIQYQANFWPYGETFFHYATGRNTDGRTVSDFIAEYAKLPFIPPYLQPGNAQFSNGANFASGGAGALDEINRGFVINLNTQLTYFEDLEKLLRQKLGDEAVKKMLFEAVYLISIGTNDYGSTFKGGSTVLQSHSQERFVHMVISNLTTVIKEIYKKGGRKFGIFNVGPLGCFPSMRAIKLQQGGTKCIDEATDLAKLHNVALSKALQELENKLEGFKYSIPNLYNLIEERMNNPSKYGFKEGDIACCGSGPYRGIGRCGIKRTVNGYELCGNVSEYLFFDSGHPSERANQQMAELIWSGTSNITGPHNLKALFD